MGMVVDGRWTEEVPAETGTSGEFRRIASAFRNRITADGSSGFPAVAGRYHLYVGYHCPWAHRTIIFRALKKLEHAISISYCLPYFRENGWTYALRPEAPDARSIRSTDFSICIRPTPRRIHTTPARSRSRFSGINRPTRS